MSEPINIMRIVRGTSVDGPGLRTSIYMAGCPHHCPGCHNPSTWDETAGTPMTIDEIMTTVAAEGNNVTLTGGDPLMHPEAVRELAEAITAIGLSVWVYTGYTIEEIWRQPRLKAALSHVEAIVDGRFIQSQRDADLLFRGSTNQRILLLDGDREPQLWHNPLDSIQL